MHEATVPRLELIDCCGVCRSRESQTRLTLRLWFVHYGSGGRYHGNAVDKEDQLYDALQQQHQQHKCFHRRNGRLTRELDVCSPASNQSAISDQSIQQRIDYFHDTVLIHNRSLVFRCWGRIAFSATVNCPLLPSSRVRVSSLHLRLQMPVVGTHQLSAIPKATK